MRQTKIGIDFDNTIVCYDQVFHSVAVEQGLVPAELPASKNHVRDYLRRADQEASWTQLQGYVYGCRMPEAQAFPGVLTVLKSLRSRAIPFVIISHKTRYPYQGPRYDLHTAALSWLEINGFFKSSENEGVGMLPEQVFLNASKEEKLSCIAQQACSHFIDDLPELLSAAEFPEKTVPILFDPNEKFTAQLQLNPVKRWIDIQQHILSIPEVSCL